MAIVTLRYWAAAKEAAGIAEEAVSAGTLAEALAAALAAATGDSGGPDGAAGPDRRDERDARNARLRAILVRSSFLVDGNPVGTRAPEAVVLGDGSVVEVLPPFAGG
jgi:molybdopterin converting factor small subunit